MLDWDNTESRVRQAGRVRCEPGWRLTHSWSENLTDCDIWYVRAGRGKMTVNSRKIELFPGTCIWMRPGGRYLAQQDPNHRLMVTFVHFDIVDRLTSTYRSLEDLPPELHHLNPIFADPLLNQIVDLTAQLDQVPIADHRLKTAGRLLDGLLMKLSYAPGSYDAEITSAPRARHINAIRQLMSDIREDPSANWTVAEMAKALNVVPDHLSRLFKNVAGVGPRQFVITAKIERAKLLLRDQDLPVWEVAELLGYSSCYYFSRQFKSVTGYTPSEIRRATQ